jgi:ferric-dicitrate binding protein FerR (iron transport regulator)
MMNTATDHNRIDELITGYFSQEQNNDELKELRDWIVSSNDNKAYFMQMQEVWFSAIGDKNEFRFNKEKAFQRFLIRTEKDIEKENTPIFLFTFQRIAAAVALLIVLAGSGYWLLCSNHLNQQLADVTIEAPLGSRTKMHLPDGTLVWLNAGSKITYSSKFGVNDRKVSLEGEGYFEVTKNKLLPFDVRTSDMTVRVLGTKFNFRNYNDEEEARVTLLEGRVSFNSGLKKSEDFFLSPNQQAVLDKKMNRTLIFSVKAKYVSEWTKGFIFFDEERLPDMVRELERSYNVKINIADDSLRNCRFYGNFPRTEQTIQEVLNVLASTNRLKYKIQGKEITLTLK